MDPTVTEPNGSPPPGPPQGDDRITFHHKAGTTWWTADGAFPIPLLVNALTTAQVFFAQQQLLAGRLPPQAPGRRIVLPDGSLPPPG